MSIGRCRRCVHWCICRKIWALDNMCLDWYPCYAGMPIREDFHVPMDVLSNSIASLLTENQSTPEEVKTTSRNAIRKCLAKLKDVD